MEAELQKANNKVCHTGHLLNQLTAKVKTNTLSLKLQKEWVLYLLVHLSLFSEVNCGVNGPIKDFAPIYIHYLPLICPFFSCHRVKVFSSS